MDFKEASRLTVSEIYKSLDSSERGLNETAVKAQLLKFGENKIKSKETTAWDIFVRQFKSPFTYLLFIASILSFALGEKLDGVMIGLFVVLNAVLSFIQEYRSEQTVKLLKKYFSPKIRVVRDKKEENIEVSMLVPGDVVILEPGDIIPADIRFTEDFNLVVDETVLTGESAPVSKTSEELKKTPGDIYGAVNIGFSGTILTSGHGRGIVFATGSSTGYAEIVKLAGETKRVSSFEIELSKFSKFTLWVVLATLLFIVITTVALKPNPSLSELIIFSIALSVSVIPETLPAVMTFCLSIGARSLTKKSVVVKRLTSVEDLGALQVLASDKTGTLTENKLEVTHVFAKDKGKTLLFAILAEYFIDSSRNSQSNAFDVALQKSLSKDGLAALNKYKKIGEIPFDPERKRVSSVVKQGNTTYLVTRGAPDEIFKACGTVADLKTIEEWVVSEGKEGRRSLGVAVKKLNDVNIKNLSAHEKAMEFLGVVSFTDPIKPSSYKAIEKAKYLGVKVKIITGDSPEVAGAVAKEIGLIEDAKEVISGAEFEKLNVTQKHEAVNKFHVFARIIPEQKHQIITLLKEGSYVGFLGEGINDAPALKAANVGVVVESAADVAKEASDIVLLEKDLEVVMDGITEGRKVFANTSKYITATMASNFGNFFAIALITPFIDFLPMLPLQIILLDLLSDFPMIMVSTDNVDPEVLKVPKRYNLKSFAQSALSFGIISTAFDFIVFNYFVRMGEASLHTYWYIESVLSELLIIFTVRSVKPFFKAIKPSKPIIYLTIGTIAVTLVIPFIPLMRLIFGFITPSFKGISSVLMIVFVYLVANETAKIFLRRYQKY